MADWTGWLRERLRGLDTEVPREDVATRAARLIQARTIIGGALESIEGRSGAPLFGAFISADAALELQRNVGSELNDRLAALDVQLVALLASLAGAPPLVPAEAPPQDTRSIWQRLFGSRPTVAAVAPNVPVAADPALLARLSPTLPVALWLSLIERHESLRAALSAAPPAGARTAIEEALARRIPGTVLPLVNALGRLGDPRAEPALRALLWATKDVETKWAVITALVRSDRRRAAEFASGTVEERVATVEGLGGFVEVCSWLNDGSSMVTQEARRQVALLDPRIAVAGLARVLAEGNDGGRTLALELIAPLIDAQAANVVEPLLGLVTREGPLRSRADELLAQCVTVPSLGRSNLQSLKRARLPPDSKTKAALEARHKPQAASTSASPGLPQLEDALEDARESDPSWLIYADALTATGDRCGEAITSANQGKPPRDFLEANAEELLGRVPAVLGDGQLPLLLDGLRYRAGLIDGAHLRLSYDLAQRVRMEDLLEAFLEAPATRMLSELEVGLVTFDSDENEYAEVVETLARSERAKRIRSLLLGAFDYPDELEISWAPWGDVSGVWAALPALRSLHLRGARGNLGTVLAPALERLTIETGGLQRETFDAVLNASVPKLQHLELWFGDENYGAGCGLAEAERLIAKLPASVTSLGVCNAEFTPELIPLLARSKALPRLKRLSLSHGVLNASDVPTLLAHASAFAHLEALDLERNQLDETDTTLTEALPRARLGEQRESDEGARYVAVGE
jgi:hypothetical protein